MSNIKKDTGSKQYLCKNCNEDKPLVGRGLCRDCYNYLKVHGGLKKFPLKRFPKQRCVKCKKFARVRGDGFCQTCNTGKKQVFVEGERIVVPVGHKLPAREYRDNQKKEILEDLLKNPGKYLDQV